MDNISDEIEKCVQVLKEGGVIIYPTDTIWGIGCDATNEEACKKVARIKQRSDNNSFICLISDETMLNNYLRSIPEVAYDIIDYAENPTTIIFSSPKNISQTALAKDGSIGMRLVKDDFCKKLIQKLKHPLVSSSANIHGEQSPASFNDIPDSFLSKADYVVNLKQEENTSTRPSSIIKLENDGRIAIIRK